MCPCVPVCICTCTESMYPSVRVCVFAARQRCSEGPLPREHLCLFVCISANCLAPGEFPLGSVLLGPYIYKTEMDGTFHL
jgi:hypothetical protein